MDALAGYGSDTSSSVSSSSNNNNDKDDNSNIERRGNKMTTMILSNLLVQYSDGDNDDSDSAASSSPIGRSGKRPRTAMTSGTTSTTTRSSAGRRTAIIIGAEATSRDDSDTAVTTTARRRHGLLPPPPLLTSHGDCANALVSFDRDYLSDLISSNFTEDGGDATMRTALAEKLEEMRDQFLVYRPMNDSSSTNKHRDSELASNLKSKKEFGNPALFPSIVNHFGIDVSGSNICPEKFGRFEFVDRLLESEERARIRSAERNRRQDDEEVCEGK